MTEFFSLDKINELVLQSHSYISKIGIKIIDDENCKGSSFLENHFFDFLNLLEIVEERKDLEPTDDKLQNLVLRLYGYVENECVYYNSKYLDIDDPMFSGSIIVISDTTVVPSDIKTVLDIIDNVNPTIIDWQNDIVPNGTQTYAEKHGNLGYAYSAKWKNPGTGNYEKNDGYSIEDEYSIGGVLETVIINISDTPFKFIII